MLKDIHLHNLESVQLHRPSMSSSDHPLTSEREVLIEFAQIGTIMRVTAMDVETGTEITFQAPAKHPPSDLKRMAVSKLNYVLRKGKS